MSLDGAEIARPVIVGAREGGVYRSTNGGDTWTKITNGIPADDFARVIREVNLGLPFEQAMENMVRRVRSEDLELMATAINIQHIESLNDVVTRTTGVRVRETIPDHFLRRADEERRRVRHRRRALRRSPPPRWCEG